MKRRSEQQTLSRRVARRATRLVMAIPALVMGVLALATMLVTLGATPASAQVTDIGVCPDDLDSIPASDTSVRIAQVSGLLDPVVHGYILDELRIAEEQGALGLVLQLNSNGSVLDDRQLLELATALDESPITIAIWVGQSGSAAHGGAAELLGVADIVGVSAGSTIGSSGPARLPDSFPPAFGDATERLETSTIGAEEAVRLGISVGPLQDVVTIGPFVTQLPGYEVVTCLASAGDVVPGSGAVPDGEAEQGDPIPLTIPVTATAWSGLPIISQLFHTVASPEVAYLLFTIGLGLLIFELYTAGVGVAGVIGAGFLTLGSYGLAVLPTRSWGIGLLLIAFLLMAIDIQTNVPRLYTAIGMVAFVIGTLVLYDGVSMSWVTTAVGIIGAALYAYTGMPSMVRTRFSTPTIGRGWMIGEMGKAVTDVSPEGTVKIGEASWRAITNRATPVKAGDPVRVVGLDRLLLEIEPEEGGAKDYRERG